MKISVLVPIYGVEKYIARCAESLFGQTYADLEFVFVNDCTPDHSIDVLRSVMVRYPARQAQVRIIHNEKNSGIGAVRQKLIDSCTGDCLTFVDSDDYMPLDAISLLAAGMERSGADMVDGGWQRVTRDGISAVNKPYQGGDERHYLSLLLCQNMVSNRMWGRLYRRSLFTENGIRLVPGIDFSEDYSVMARLLFYASRAAIDAPVYFYSEENASSYTHTASPRHARSYLMACRVVLDFFSRNDTAGRYLAPLQFGMANALRNIRRAGFSLSLVDQLLGYRPQGAFFRLLAAMLRGKCPLAVSDFTYLLARKIYLSVLNR